jgi:hypothetical protein
MTARILLIGAFLYFAALIGGLYVKLHAQEKCAPVDPAAMVWTGHGFSIAMGDGHLWINREDVVYAEVSQPHVCMPAKGMMQLWLPHAWPSYASTQNVGKSAQLPTFSIIPAHDGYEKWMQPHRPTVSCCNKQDCEPVEARYDDARKIYQAKIRGEWVDIPRRIVLDPKKPENHSPDGSFHACWNRVTNELLCFREAEPKI